MKKSKKIDRSLHFLVISTTGIGDTLMGTPALRALRRSFPESRIHLLLHGQKKGLFLPNPHVDLILGYRDNPFSRSLLSWKTRSIAYDHVLVFHANDDLWKILKRIRYGDCFTRQKFHNPEKRVYTIEALPCHSIQRRMALVERVGGKPSTDYRYELSIPEREVQWAQERIAEWGGRETAPLVGFQLGAADRFKCWPVENFVELAGRLRKAFQVRIYLNASEEEKDLVREFKRLYGADGLAYDLGLSLTQSAAIIQSCSLFISPDTGPMHMAIGLDVPLIALFGPTPVEETGPLGFDRAMVIRKTVPCEPCGTRRCTDNFCMRQISVKEVFAAAEKILGQGVRR